MEQHSQPSSEPAEERRKEGCTAPHPARAFLLALPAFAIVIGAVLLVWALL
jgi:hypothetical protein